MSRIVEAREFADFGGDGDGGDKATPRMAWSASTTGAMTSWDQILDLLRQARDPLFSVMHGVDIVLQDQLLGRVVEAQRRQPAAVGQRPSLLSGVDAAMPQQEPCRVTRLANTLTAVARARIRSLMASWASSGVQTAVNSPARCSLASIAASRRSVLIRSPAFIQISEAPRALIKAKSCDLPMQPIAARTSFVTEP